MAKKDQNALRDVTAGNAARARARTQGDIYGGGAFGPTGLAGGYSQAQRNAQGAYDTASGTFSDFAKTGGMSPTDRQTYLRAATEPISSTYKVLGDQAQRQLAATGGMGTGGNISQLARQGDEATSRANTRAVADLNQQVSSNKLAGASGMSQLFNISTGEISDMGKQILSVYGLENASQQQQVDALSQLARQPGAFQTIFGDVLGAAGATGGLLTGIGSLSRGGGGYGSGMGLNPSGWGG